LNVHAIVLAFVAGRQEPHGGTMAEDVKPAAQPDEPPISDPRLTAQGAISDEALRKAEEFVEQEEGAANRLIGWAGIIVTAIAVAMTVFHLYAAYEIVSTQPLRYVPVAFVLVRSEE